MLIRFISLLICHIIAILTFATGFFPQKSVLQGDADFIHHPEQHRSKDPIFDKLVLVVIDALRADFMFQEDISNFHFVHELLNKGEAWGFTAYSNPPTVTLPRLKGITTGSAPNFLDAILNVAEDDSSSNLKEQDSLIRQLYRHDKTIHFFGDDTWLKLFPSEFFERYEGTSSFFVSDFEVVDNNVTRHLRSELSRQDWDTLILHYLGLDHIGHKQGPMSHYMPAKHMEMDGVIKELYENIGNDTLLCVLGDHGMNEFGNHGGSSAGETSAAMVFISKKLANYQKPAAQRDVYLPIKNVTEDYSYLTKIQQVDLVPTLASLLNIPIPKNSLGVLIKPFLAIFGGSAELKLKDNYCQLMSLASGKQLHSDADVDTILQEMRVVQEELAQAITCYNYTYLTVGIVLLLLISIADLVILVFNYKMEKDTVSIVCISLVIGISAFSSSFIEEEHQVWWWMLIAIIGSSWSKNISYTWSHILLLACLRLVRGWNNSGQKFFYDYTIYEILTEQHAIKWILIVATLLAVCIDNIRLNPLPFLLSLCPATICFLYKGFLSIANGEPVPSWLASFLLSLWPRLIQDDTLQITASSLVMLARAFFQSVAGAVILQVFICRYTSSKPIMLKSIIQIVTIVLIFQTQSSNIPLFLVYTLIKNITEHLILTLYESEKTASAFILSLLMQNFAFFQFGGTNSIATIDLANAYNGVSENYNIYVVGLLMFISNFAPAIYWTLYPLVIQNENLNKKEYTNALFLRFLYYCTSGICLLIACLSFRYHLFVWSVFSPKLCYYITWCVIMHGVIDIIISPLLLYLTS